MQKLVTGRDPTLIQVFDPASYRLEAVSCREDMDPIIDRLSRWQPGSGGLSLCLYGPPGTGKSELVKYLAWRMGRRVLHRRVSDIVSCWVGMTERHIADAFREAETEEAVLLFDEADSFLRDRRGAERSWEVTEVNEFLQQLETFGGVVACTTNLWKDIDQAALRRFVFKLELGYLSAERAVVLFRELFGRPWTAEVEANTRRELSRLTTLTPGDFAAVRRRIRALDLRPEPSRLLEELASEVQAKGACTRGGVLAHGLPFQDSFRRRAPVPQAALVEGA
jgi:SpoVK/Ycf46/Vps4 family AAA+-type ATPase